nr:glycosyltransferase family 9 protein [uncultured Cetobacterium sp.]
MKKLGYIIGKLFLDKKRNLNIKGKKVLINDCQKIGNYLFKTPLIKGLALNGYEVSILGSKVTQELANSNPYVKEIIIDNSYRKKSTDIFRNIKTGLKYRGKFDYYVELVGSIYLRELILMKILKAKKIIGLERKHGKKFNIIDRVIKKQTHMRENSVEVLKAFGIKDPGGIYDIHLGRRNKYEKMIKRKPLILYNGIASTKSRSISLEDEKKILNNLSKIKWAEVRKIEREDSVLDLCSLIKKADLVVTVDTGITHIASAFDIPVLVHKSDERVFPLSGVSIEKSFYDEDLNVMAEDILEYIYTMTA